MRRSLSLLSLFALLVSASFWSAGKALADCTNPSMAEGTVFYNSAQNVPEICAGSTWVALGALNPGAGSGKCSNPTMAEGAMFYNDDHDVLQYCDGQSWHALQAAVAGGGGCTAPASCPNVGDVCSDGSIFAGFMDYSAYGGGSCEPLYVTDNNQSTSSQWKTATGTNDITDPSDRRDAVDGQYNRDNRGSGTFPAFELCENNTYHGKSDWYLPARAELNLLWLNQAAIDANAAGNFTTSNYWSSTEYTTIYAWNQHFGYGNQNYVTKTNSHGVRCVRRGIKRLGLKRP